MERSRGAQSPEERHGEGAIAVSDSATAANMEPPLQQPPLPPPQQQQTHPSLTATVLVPLNLGMPAFMGHNQALAGGAASQLPQLYPNQLFDISTVSVAGQDAAGWATAYPQAEALHLHYGLHAPVVMVPDLQVQAAAGWAQQQMPAGSFLLPPIADASWGYPCYHYQSPPSTGMERGWLEHQQMLTSGSTRAHHATTTAAARHAPVVMVPDLQVQAAAGWAQQQMPAGSFLLPPIADASWGYPCYHYQSPPSNDIMTSGTVFENQQMLAGGSMLSSPGNVAWPQQQMTSQSQLPQAYPSSYPGGYWMPQQQQAPASSSVVRRVTARVPVQEENVTIREVWAETMHEACDDIEAIVKEAVGVGCCYVTVDTEFAIPDGVNPLPHEPSTAELHYYQLRSYVDGGNLVQIGLGFADRAFNLIAKVIFQFNIQFDPAWRLPGHKGVAFLRSNGFALEEFAARGVPAAEFRSMLMQSGVLCNSALTWVSYMGYPDMGFMLGLLLDRPLPQHRSEFLELVAHFFPSTLDCKYCAKYSNGIPKNPVRWRLDDVAEALGVRRTGNSHQAGSDALVALRVLERLMVLAPVFMETAVGVLYGVCNPMSS